MEQAPLALCFAYVSLGSPGKQSQCHVHVSVSVSISSHVCLSVCLSVHLTVCLFM